MKKNLYLSKNLLPSKKERQISAKISSKEEEEEEEDWRRIGSKWERY